MPCNASLCKFRAFHNQNTSDPKHLEKGSSLYKFFPFSASIVLMEELFNHVRYKTCETLKNFLQRIKGSSGELCENSSVVLTSNLIRVLNGDQVLTMITGVTERAF